MKRFWQKNENNTVEQWLVQAIHEKTEFSFCLKDIPSASFESNFRRKYEIEFMKLDQLGEPPLRAFDNTHNLAISSAHSSVYSQNLARTVSMASVAQASNNQKAEEPCPLIKAIDVNKVNNQFNETSTSSLIRNSQNTAES
jgi:hypothetical protein